MDRSRRDAREAVLRQACLQAAADAYEDAGLRGLCAEGRWECALDAMRAVDLARVPGANADAEPEMQPKPGTAAEPQTGPPARLARGGRMPHVTLAALDGATVAYQDIWQRRNLLLVALPPAGDAAARGDAAWLTALREAEAAFRGHETEVVITREAVAGLPAPAVLVADRWGEIVTIERAAAAADLPPVAALREWARFVDHACPECEGEAR